MSAIPFPSSWTPTIWRTGLPCASGWGDPIRRRPCASIPTVSSCAGYLKRILTPGEMEQFTLRREELPEGVRTVTFQIEEGEAK